MGESRDELADRYARIAYRLVGKLRDEHIADVDRWFDGEIAALAASQGRPVQLADYKAVAYMDAAAVPDDIEWTVLTEWTLRRVGWDLKDHGTHAAAERHRYHKEPPCALCRAYESGYKNGRRHRGKRASDIEEGKG